MKIVNFGSCNIDYVYSLDKIVIPAETKESNSLSIFPGGKGLNQSIAAAKAGAHVYHVGCIGRDGALLKNTLIDGGVDITYLEELDSPSGHAIIQVSDDGQNSIIIYGGANRALTKEKIDSVLDDFGKGDLLFLQNETNLVDYIIEKAHEKEMVIFFNPAPFDKKLTLIDYNKVDYLILNEVEAHGLGGSDTSEGDLLRLSELYPNTTVILTLGEQGCAYMKNGHPELSPAFKVDAVDTTAAGDTFIGYFIAEISRNSSIDTAISVAQAASAISVTRKGASVSIPTYDEVLKSLKSTEL